MDGLMRQKLEHREQRIAFAELRESVRQESERVERVPAQSSSLVPAPAPVSRERMLDGT